MLTPEEIQFLTQFVMSRPLNGLNLYDVQKVMEIITKLNKKEDVVK